MCNLDAISLTLVNLSRRQHYVTYFQTKLF